LGIGFYCTHSVDWDNDASVKSFSGWLIDEQQRLTTIERYWTDEFKVYGRYFSELTRKEIIRFMRISFKQRKVSLNDEQLIKDLYNRMAFGGTPHNPENLAV
jgi:hypothetical protein